MGALFALSVGLLTCGMILASLVVGMIWAGLCVIAGAVFFIPP